MCQKVAAGGEWASVIHLQVHLPSLLLVTNETYWLLVTSTGFDCSRDVDISEEGTPCQCSGNKSSSVVFEFLSTQEHGRDLSFDE